ncbi:MAG: peroxiredoxin [Pseudanabaenaceae cyanobacterium bins.68]|nr:peroxiredoxin [Pseudanabaenaceae cyanobacterium bins.68]
MLRVGELAPDFAAIAVVGQEFQALKLADFCGQYVILFFYPADFTFVCPTEVMAFSDRVQEFSQLNTQILGVSVDSQFCHLAWIQTERSQGGVGELKYPLLSDSNHQISQAYGVLDQSTGRAARALFIIDPQGMVQHLTINNLGFGRSVTETWRALSAIQQIQKFPNQFCPVDWQPGEPTIFA